METLQKIQEELKAPKSQRNSFGNYNYRSLEDIFEALKPILAKYKASLIVSDTIEMIGTRFYVRAEASLYEGDKLIASNTAYAREAETKKGMDESQITGATSSYARKYALNGLFAIDDTKDADFLNTGAVEKKLDEVSKYSEERIQEGLAEEEKNLGNCKKCGAKNVINPKTGKIFCSAKCFLN